MNIKYDLSAVEILNILGYRQPTGKNWLEKLEQEKNIKLPKVYSDFMKLMSDCPLLGTSNLWIGEMSHGTCVPWTLYESLQTEIADHKDCWPKRPGKYEKALLELSQFPPTEWPAKLDNYLLIGSDYANGIGVFGVLMQDLVQDDPPVYWHKDSDAFNIWKPENEKISDFLLNVLIEALACVDYQSAEQSLKAKGWRYEEYYDLKKDDWVASKAVLKRYGINYSELTKYKANSGKVFCCYAVDKNAIFVGSTEGGEISLSVINRNEAENIFLDMDSLEFLLEEARLSLRNQDLTADLQQYYLYVKTPQNIPGLADYCCMDRPPQKDENGKIICPTTVKSEPLYALCSSPDFLNVVSKTLRLKPKASNSDLAAALADYLKAADNNL